VSETVNHSADLYSVKQVGRKAGVSFAKLVLCRAQTFRKAMRGFQGMECGRHEHISTVTAKIGDLLAAIEASRTPYAMRPHKELLGL
jgi:hypothetical protein